MTSSSDLFMHPANACVIEEIGEDDVLGPSSSSVSDAPKASGTPESEAPRNSEASAASTPQQEEAAEAVQPGAPGTSQQSSNQEEAGPSQSNAAATSASTNSESNEEVVDPQLQQVLDTCEQLKQEGNAAFGRGDYDFALQCYWQAIDQAPEDAQQRSVYFCNAAACYLKKEMWQLAVEQCTNALKINEAYLKALVRRAQALQHLDDLERALADAQKVLELDPGNAWASKVVAELAPEVQRRQEKLKDEMMGKLKDLGNTLLGKFGLSLDNFKAEQDPNTGGYSIKFTQ